MINHYNHPVPVVMNLIISLYKKIKTWNMYCLLLAFFLGSKRNNKTASIVILLLLTTLSLKAQKQDAFIANGKKVFIDSLNKDVITMMEEVGVPGVSLAVIDNNKIVFYNTYGYKQKDGERIDSATVFEGCSLSKSFLVFVVYQLVDEGRFDLDKPMYQYLENESLSYDPRYKKITARMILSHSSGLENWKGQHNPNRLDIISDPGEAYVYSGEGYKYLAKVVEGILKMPYEDYVRDRVIKPLGLKNTYTSFNKQMNLPPDYAFGHDIYGNKVAKYSNVFPDPACGNHFTAEDYAKLIIAIFNKEYLSGNTIKEILKPVIRLNKADTAVYYGPGFEVWNDANDRIISHGGSNPGFKNMIFYSIARKSGFVFLTNSDRGPLMATRLCNETAGINISPKFKYDYFEQYPSMAINLWKIYNDNGADMMFAKIEELKHEGNLGDNTLNELGDLFMARNEDLSMKLLENSREMYPQSSLVYALLGDLYMQKADYDVAVKNFDRAKELNFNLWPLEDNIKQCKDNLKCTYKIISDTALTIKAEDYCATSGIIPDEKNNRGVNDSLVAIAKGNWMDYRIDVVKGGTYTFTSRIASDSAAQFQMQSGTTVLKKIDVGTAKRDKNWTTVKTSIDLPAGKQTLRLYVLTGRFNITWIQIGAAKE